MKNTKILKKLLKKQIINETEIFLYKLLKKNENLLVKIIIILLIYTYNTGHISLNIKKKYSNKNIPKKIWKKFFNIKNYDKIIENSKIIGKETSYNFPIIFYKKKFYFNKIFIIKKFFLPKIFTNTKINKNIKNIKKIFKKYDNNKLNKLQKISVIMSIIKKIIFIIGNPGTGKTTVISSIIFFILKICKKIKKIKIAAMTGRAAHHMLNSIKKNLSKLKIKKNEKQNIPDKSYTIHRLLKIKSEITYVKFNKNKKINADLLIIDEASMITPILFQNLIESTKKNTKIIFLGDFNQLPPINEINIFKYLCKNLNNQFSNNMSKMLKYIINYKNKCKKKNTIINDHVCILKKKYRFTKKSGIQKISNMILKNDIENIRKEIKKNELNDVIFKEIKNFSQYKNMIKIIIRKYKKYWQSIKKKNNPKNILKEFNNIRILCAIKNGPFGTKEINKNIKKMMINQKIINKNKKWYIGKPIMIKKNQKNLNIFNGYIGILLYDKNKKKKFFFITNDNNIIKLPTYVIKNYETSWSSTIHKSQGSEFNETIIIIPNKKKNFLSKNLIYTGITRTRKKTIIFSNKKTFIKSIQNK
ncbi:exodeoxyribonuclease V subunit alpha [Buchnera aphidicola (Astegopteryx bambusae)]|uniref:exodeoxyribonuclease V subunit alpha n=1 Tax=Buchnera aphidicola TaxID=9 RepID=UPI0031B8280F